MSRETKRPAVDGGRADQDTALATLLCGPDDLTPSLGKRKQLFTTWDVRAIMNAQRELRGCPPPDRRAYLIDLLARYGLTLPEAERLIGRNFAGRIIPVECQQPDFSLPPHHYLHITDHGAELTLAERPAHLPTLAVWINRRGEFTATRSVETDDWRTIIVPPRGRGWNFCGGREGSTFWWRHAREGTR